MLSQNYIAKRLREGGLSLEDDTEEPKRLITPTKANPDNKKYIPGGIAVINLMLHTTTVLYSTYYPLYLKHYS